MPAYYTYEQQATGLDAQYHSPTSTSTSSNSSSGWIPGWATEQVSAGANTAIKQIAGVRQLVTRWWKASSADTLPIDGASADAEGAEGDTAARDQQQAGAANPQPGHKRTRSWNDAWAQLPQLRLKDMTQHLPALPVLPFAGRRDDGFALPVTNQQASNMLVMEQRRKEMAIQDTAAHLHHWAMS